MLGGLCPGVVSVRGGSVWGVGSLSGKKGLCPGRGSLSGEGVSVWGGGLCLGRGSLSGGLYLEGSLSKGVVSVLEGSLSKGGGLCPGGSLVQCGVSVQEGLCHRDPPYGNERAVRILLECILVRIVYSSDFGASGFLRGKNVYHWILIRLAILPMGN